MAHYFVRQHLINVQLKMHPKTTSETDQLGHNIRPGMWQLEELCWFVIFKI